MTTLPQAITSGLPQVLVYLVWLALLVIAIIRWRAHPKISLLVTLAVLLLFASAFLGYFLNTNLALWFHERGFPGERLGLLIFLFAFVRSIITALAWILVGVAIFGWRKS